MLDVPTLLASAAISAIVGTFFAVVTTTRMTVLRVRAERRESALEVIRSTVRPLQRTVLRYSDGFAPNSQRDSVSHPQDALEASHILEAAEAFGLIRRWLVRRRCGRVFGREYTWLASRHLGMDGALTMTTVLSVNLLRGGRTGNPVTYSDGLLQRALMTAPGSRPLRALSRELWLLAHLL